MIEDTNKNIGSDIYMNTPYNGEQIRRAYETKPWKSDYEIYDDIIEEEQEGSDEIKGVVDLGLPSGLLWATCNLGATSPEEYGKYYQWGDTEGYYENQLGDQEGQKIFSWDTYKYAEIVNEKPKFTKYCNDRRIGYEGYTDDLTTLESSDDAATSEYGNKWRIPTLDDFEELLKGTTHEFDSNGNLILTSKSNGNIIMFPASGHALGNSIVDVEYGEYRSSSLYGSNCLFSWNLYFSSGKNSVGVNYPDRYFGLPIRPVNTSRLKRLCTISVETNPNPSGGWSVEGSGEYYQEETCRLSLSSFKPSTEFINWTKNGEIVSTEQTYEFTVTKDATYTANFGYRVTATPKPPVGGTVSGGGVYSPGSSCTLIATPAEGCVFSKWMDHGKIIGNSNPYTFTPSKNTTLTAVFGLPQATVNVSANPSEGGTVIGGGTYNIGSEVTVSATSNTGYTFTNWTENGNVVSSSPDYTFTLNGDRNLVANFTIDTYNIEATVNNQDRGTVSGGGTYDYGTTCTLVATPSSGDYVFSNWTENGNEVSSNSSYSFTVSEDRTIVANFGKTECTIIVSSSNNDNNSVYIGDTPGITQETFEYSQSCTIHALEYNNGYVFNGWVDNNVITSENPTYTFIVTDDKTLVANYVEENYLTFTANQDNSSIGFVIKTEGSVSSTPQVSLQYSIDNCVTWNTYTIGLGSENAQLINLNNGNSVKFRGTNPNGVAIRETSNIRSYLNCITNGSISASGDLNSIINNRGGDIILPNYCYYYVFSNCISLTTVPELSSTHLADYCYNNMFKGCTSLTQAPELPATTLATSCYYGMFQDCTSLVEAPELPATTLASYCYQNMFNGCTGLTQAPELPATILANYCYDHMFNRCTGLVEAPQLPATTLAEYCYQYMFNGCTSLTQAPQLPSTTLANTCYSNMFRGCTSLVDAPELPSTTLVSSCYNSMFENCTSLVEAPELPSTTLVSGCYAYMFKGCTGLVDAPELPSTTLANGCYSNMFTGCTSLTQAPQLPATTLAENCYENMFLGCTGLVDAPQLNATTLSVRCCSNMFNGCTGLTQVPTRLPATTLAGNCYENMFKGCTSLVEAPELPATNLTMYCYQNMFEGCTSLVEAPQLPATNLNFACYSNMFKGCTSLTQAPTRLPATTLAQGCYSSMFLSCTSLVEAPELNATTLSMRSCGSMFQGCTSLTKAPTRLSATNLATSCYEYMFRGCTSLVEAPELPATILVSSCYNSMFQGCTSLNYIKCLATDISASGCTNGWVNGVSESGTFVKDPNMNSWTTGNDGIPEGWTVQDNV